MRYLSKFVNKFTYKRYVRMLPTEQYIRNQAGKGDPIMTIARTVAAIDSLEHPLAAQIVNRQQPLTPYLASAVMSCTQFSWQGRSPRSARSARGVARTTDLDLLSLLYELAQRSARIEIPSYQASGAWRVVEHEQHIGTKRFGRITGLVSHRDHLSFSVRISDQSVVDRRSGQVGGHERSYMLARHDGAWHTGWQGFTWQPSVAEANFIQVRKIEAEGGIPFGDYVHRNRRQSICGAPYLLLKLLWQRIQDEVTFYRAELTRLAAVGIERPRDLVPGKNRVLVSGPTQSVMAPVFQVRLAGLPMIGEYSAVPESLRGYLKAHYHIHFLTQRLRPLVQFMMRADEVAFFRFGKESSFTPWWVKDSAWRSAGNCSATLELGERIRLTWHEDQVPLALAA